MCYKLLIIHKISQEMQGKQRVCRTVREVSETGQTGTSMAHSDSHEIVLCSAVVVGEAGQPGKWKEKRGDRREAVKAIGELSPEMRATST